MSTVSTVPRQSPIAALALRPIVAALAITVLVTAARMTDTVDSDVAWQLWIAGRLHAGAQLYLDIIEVNPPLWFWMAFPVERTAALLDVRPEPVLVAAIGTAVALSLVATDRLIRHILPGRRALLLGYASLLLMAAAWMHVGQREQILLIGTMPYAALIAARRTGTRVPAPLAVLVGIGAALGFALKHYFLIIPAMLELWLIAGLGRHWRWRRPEVAAIAATGAAYACAVLIFAPAFLTTVVGMVRLAYGEIGAPSIRHLFGPSLVVGLVAFAFAAAQVRHVKAPLTSALLVAAAASAIVYFIQAKGWPYHAIPLLGCASLPIAALFAEADAPRPMMRLFAPALLLLPFGLAYQEAHAPFAPGSDLEKAISGMERGDTVAFLAADNAIPWSVTMQHGFQSPSRYMSYWMLGAVVANERRSNPDPRLAELGERVVAETVNDFRCQPPKRIIVPRPRPGEPGFDILAFFRRDPRFGALLTHYRTRSRTSMEALDLASPLPPSDTRCRAGFSRGGGKG